MSKKVKIINLLVFFAWITLLSILLYKNYTGIPLEGLHASTESFGEETLWYDIYTGSKKIGLASTTFKRVGDEIIIQHEREIKVRKEGHERLHLEMLKCLSDPNYSIKSFEYTSRLKGEKGIKITGEVDSEDIVFFLESPEKRKVFKTPREGRDFYLPTTFIPALVQKNPSPNSAFIIPMIDFYNFSINEVKVLLEEIRPLKAGVTILSLYKFKAGNTIWWSSDRGIIVKEKSPTGITLYSQVEPFVKDPADRVLFDYTALPSIKSNKLLSDTETLNMLKVKIRGFDLKPNLYRNSLITLDNDVLTIEAADVEDVQRKTYRLPHERDTLPMKKYLSHDAWVKSNYKPLRDTGRIFAKSYDNDAFRFTHYLTGYLFRLVRTNPMFILSDAKDILKSLSGDYLERTIMFASYSRAAGLPTRLVGGLVYQYGYFYFHTWPEVWFDKWIPVDPTLVQFPADVTHIPLKEGTLMDITSIVEDLKTVTIEIVEAS